MIRDLLFIITGYSEQNGNSFLYTVQVAMAVKEISFMNNSDKVESQDHQVIWKYRNLCFQGTYRRISSLTICFHSGPQINLQNHKADHLFLEDWDFPHRV